MAKKYYAVRKGRKPGIYNSWEECKPQIDGFSGASYKSFTDINSAQEFIGEIPSDEKSDTSEIIAYVDGSYDETKKAFSYGMVILIDGKEFQFSQKFDNAESELLEMHNVAGEITGARKAMEYCIANGYDSIDIYHDYDGIAKWCTGEWKANKNKTKEYQDFYNSIKDKITIKFIKVKGHSGDKYNELADSLAKDALNDIGFNDDSQPTNVDNNTKSKTEVFLDKEEAENLVNKCCKELWGEDYNYISFSTVGNGERFEYSVSDNIFKIDFYFKKNGTVTINSVGKTSEENNLLIEKIESSCYKNEHKNASCTFSKIDDESLDKLLLFINDQEKIDIQSDERIDTPPKHRFIVLKSRFGDKISLSRFENNNLRIQGNPAYILSQIMYYMSIQSSISESDINNSQKELYNANISVTESRNLLKDRIPNAYDKIDEQLKKILSPSITLSNSSIEVDEYSCYVFPAFKGLEQLLLSLFFNKSIIINYNASKGSGEYKNFGAIFKYDDTNDIFYLKSDIKSLVNDSVYESCLEKIYNYFNKNRNVYFHANQIIVLTGIITSKTEADAILSDVFQLIDDVGLKIL